MYLTTNNLTVSKVNIILFLLLVFFNLNTVAQPHGAENKVNQDNELTIFVIRSVLPLDWESPSSLYKSYRKEMSTKLWRKQKSMLGHTFVLLRSPLLTDSIFAGMTYVSKKVQKKLFMKEKIGMGILGICMEGRMQPHEELLTKMNYYASKNEVAFIRYNISEKAAHRIIEFYNSFISSFDGKQAKCDFYGGAFWPRYDKEGSGCSAFGFSFLDVAQILENIPDWKKSVHIPMELIGGELNNNRKIKIRDIKKTSTWAQSDDASQVDYVPFEVYSPSAVYYWIKTQRELPDSLRKVGYMPVNDFEIPGIFADRSNVQINENEPVFLHRDEDNIFIRYFYKKTGISLSNEISSK